MFLALRTLEYSLGRNVGTVAMYMVLHGPLLLFHIWYVFHPFSIGTVYC